MIISLSKTYMSKQDIMASWIAVMLVQVEKTEQFQKIKVNKTCSQIGCEWGKKKKILEENLGFWLAQQKRQWQLYSII